VSLLRLPSFGLLLSMVALVLVEPFAERVRGGLPLLAVFHFGMLGLAVRMVGSARGQVTAAWLLALPTVTLNVLYLFVEPALAIPNFVMLAAFYAYVIFCLLDYVLRDTDVGVDELFAATCSYVLLALAFACMYSIVELVEPGSFSIPGGAEPNEARFWDLVYFSITTLTSTGFGDIHPLAREARAVVIVEQVAGVMFVAILIARLTGMNLSRRQPRAD
jgi:hypothetical protein